MHFFFYSFLLTATDSENPGITYCLFQSSIIHPWWSLGGQLLCLWCTELFCFFIYIFSQMYTRLTTEKLCYKMFAVDSGGALCLRRTCSESSKSAAAQQSSVRVSTNTMSHKTTVQKQNFGQHTHPNQCRYGIKTVLSFPIFSVLT